MTTSRKIPPLNKRLHSHLESKMCSLKSNSCKKSRKAEHTNLSCEICLGSLTEIQLFLRKKSKSNFKMKVFKSLEQESLIDGVGEQPGCSHFPALAGGSVLVTGGLTLQPVVTCVSRHLSFQKAMGDETRECLKEFISLK